MPREPANETASGAAQALRNWQAVVDGAGRPLVELAAALADPERPTVAELAHLRAHGPEELVAVAVELVRARRHAARKFAAAERLVADVRGVEQASGDLPARHKAARFAAAGLRRVADLCCGIGGDALALCDAGLEVVGVDRDPVRAFMCARNAGCGTTVADVADWAPGADAAFHLDPGRRTEGGPRTRLWRLDDLRPGRAVILRFAGSGRPGAIKLGPGVAFDDLPEDAGVWEVLGDADGLRQAVLWCGALANPRGSRTATRVDAARSFTARPLPDALPVRGAGRYLLVPDPVLERSGLVLARLTATTAPPVAELAPGLGVLTCDEPFDDPWFRRYPVCATLPFRERRLREWLRAHDAGTVTVKTRGGAAPANDLERRLRGDGNERFTVFVLRMPPRLVAVVCAPAPFQ